MTWLVDWVIDWYYWFRDIWGACANIPHQQPADRTCTIQDRCGLKKSLQKKTDRRPCMKMSTPAATDSPGAAKWPAKSSQCTRPDSDSGAHLVYRSALCHWWYGTCQPSPPCWSIHQSQSRSWITNTHHEKHENSRAMKLASARFQRRAPCPKTARTRLSPATTKKTRKQKAHRKKKGKDSTKN